jgi:hypothetical protein
MATTTEMFVATVALLTNSFLIIIFFFLNNLLLAPIFNALETAMPANPAISTGDMSYIIPYIWAILLLFEIVCIIAFLIVAARRNTMDDYYGGY